MATITESLSEDYVIPDEVWIEILLRLPLLSLQLFKSVSKHWLSLITSEYFICRLRKPRIETPCGLFISERNFEYYDFGSLGPKVISFPLRATIAEAGSCFRILQSCNGLLLCLNVVSHRIYYYVYNPFTNIFKNIPFPRYQCSTDMILAFDPTKSPCYKLVITQKKNDLHNRNWEQDWEEDREQDWEEDWEQDWEEDREQDWEEDREQVWEEDTKQDSEEYREQDWEEDRDQDGEEDREQDWEENWEDDSDEDSEEGSDEDSDTERILIYSSETGKWSICGPALHEGRFWHLPKGIYWNNAIHWINNYDGERLHSKFDIVDHPIVTNIQTPALDDVEDMSLFESRGSLLLLMEDNDHCYHIFEMREESSEWSVKYIVDDIVNTIPELYRWSHTYVLCVVLGERGDDSYMVIESDNQIVRYNFVSKTISTLYNFKPYQRSWGCFPFIASLAGV